MADPTRPEQQIIDPTPIPMVLQKNEDHINESEEVILLNKINFYHDFDKLASDQSMRDSDSG